MTPLVYVLTSLNMAAIFLRAHFIGKNHELGMRR